MNTAIRRNSRWSRSPPRGPRKRAELTAHDIAILGILARYRYLPADYIHALAGGNLKYLTHRLGMLSREPNLFVVRPLQQRDNAAANHRHMIYELDQRGIRVLQERGVSIERPRAPANFAHELMACEIMASFELGARERGARLVSWNDIRNSRNLPEATRQSPRPFHIPVHFENADFSVTADAQPFGVERLIRGERFYQFCPGIEADCGTEPVDTADFARSSIYRKLSLYLAIDAQGIYRSHFGFPNLLVPIVTTNAARLTSMMRVLQRITDGAGSRIILFKIFSASSLEPPSPPSGHMLTGDWQRVGYPPFNFLS